MNEWERDLHKIFGSTEKVPHRYELRPGRGGPSVYCSTCARLIVTDGNLYLDELIDDVMTHEKTDHQK